MIVLGLGSNLGDRVSQLKSALRQIIQRNLLHDLKTSFIYESTALLPPGSPEDWNKTYLNAIVVGQSSLEPLELLQKIKEVEVSMGRSSGPRWSPRLIDIDILFYKDVEISTPQLKVPHPEFKRRPFVLIPCLDVIPYFTPPFSQSTLREMAEPFLKTITISRYTKSFCELVAVLNLTPDSFSDGGLVQNVDDALKKIDIFLKQGANIIDIGGESTRPGAKDLSWEEEWQRVEPVFKEAVRSFKHARFSIDTRNPSVAKKALSLGAAFINDVSASASVKIAELTKDYECDLIFMHNLGIPPQSDRTLDPQADTVMQILAWAKEKIEEYSSLGIKKDRLIFDPGLGFGKTPQQNFEILGRFSEFRSLGLRTFVGASRKSFLKILDSEKSAEQRDLETSLSTAILAAAAPDYIRVHNIEENKKALNMSALSRGILL